MQTCRPTHTHTRTHTHIYTHVRTRTHTLVGTHEDTHAHEHALHTVLSFLCLLGTFSQVIFNPRTVELFRPLERGRGGRPNMNHYCKDSLRCMHSWYTLHSPACPHTDARHLPHDGKGRVVVLQVTTVFCKETDTTSHPHMTWSLPLPHCTHCSFPLPPPSQPATSLPPLLPHCTT